MLKFNLAEIEKIKRTAESVNGILRSYQKRINQLKSDNENLNYWIEEIKKENDWLTGYLKMWEELKEKSILIRDIFPKLEECIKVLEKKYLGGNQ